MNAPAILIAENDRRSLEILPAILADSIPQVSIDMCTAADELAQKVQRTSYATVAMSSLLVPHYRFLIHRKPQQSLATLVVTAGRADRTLAYRAIEKDAFDLIVKPIVPQDAVHTVKLALWQNKLLALLASRERASARFREHMQAFPHAIHIEKEYASKLAAYERTLEALNSSLRLLLDIEDETSLFDMAASVERLTRERALTRLLSLYQDGPAH